MITGEQLQDPAPKEEGRCSVSPEDEAQVGWREPPNATSTHKQCLLSPSIFHASSAPPLPKIRLLSWPFEGEFLHQCQHLLMVDLFPSSSVPTTSPEIELQALIIKSGLDSRRIHMETIKQLHFSRGARQPCQMLAASARWAFDIR